MELVGTQTIAAPRQKVWAALFDPEVLKQCIPGCELIEAVGENELTAKVTLRIGPVKASFAGRVTLTDLVPPESCTLSGEGQGGVAGFAKGSAKVRLTEEGPETTLLTYEVKADVGGKIAQLGGRLIDFDRAQARGRFLRKFRQDRCARGGRSRRAAGRGRGRSGRGRAAGQEGLARRLVRQDHGARSRRRRPVGADLLHRRQPCAWIGRGLDRSDLLVAVRASARFRAKRDPVRVKKMRQNKKSRAPFRFRRNGKVSRSPYPAPLNRRRSSRRRRPSHRERSRPARQGRCARSQSRPSPKYGRRRSSR